MFLIQKQTSQINKPMQTVLELCDVSGRGGGGMMEATALEYKMLLNLLVATL